MKLALKIALVTGSASGSGRVIALERAKEGASVALACVRRPSNGLAVQLRTP